VEPDLVSVAYTLVNRYPLVMVMTAGKPQVCDIEMTVRRRHCLPVSPRGHMSMFRKVLVLGKST
jgi:hypothetical protein